MRYHAHTFRPTLRLKVASIAIRVTWLDNANMTVAIMKIQFILREPLHFFLSTRYARRWRCRCDQADHVRGTNPKVGVSLVMVWYGMDLDLN